MQAALAVKAVEAKRKMKKFNEVFRRFADQTPIHGVSYIYATNKPVLAVVWVSLVFIAVCLAANDMSTIVNFYLSEPTGVAVDVRSNENVTIPNPTVCIEFGYLWPEEFQFETFQADIDAFLLATQNGTNLTIERYEQLNLSNNLEYFTYMMLAYITDLELYYTGEQHYQFHRVMATDLSHNYNSWNMSTKLQIVYDTYMARNVSLINLKKLIGMRICQWRHLIMQNDRYFDDPDWILLPLCEASMITHLGFSLVCSKMFKTPQLQMADAKFNKFAINYAGSTESYSADQQVSCKTADGAEVLPSWFIDFQGRPKLPPVGDRLNVLGVQVGNPDAADIFISTEYQYYSSKQRPCGTGQADCQLRKRAELMQKSCGCWPSSLVSAANSSKDQSCSENPSNPINVTGDFAKFHSCDFGLSYLTTLDSHCQRDCHIFSFTVVPKDPLVYYNLYDSAYLWYNHYTNLKPIQFSIRVDCMREVYVESTIKTWTTFVSDVGGSIGTWLGGSLLAFVHIPLFLCESCYKAVRKGNRAAPATTIPREK